MKATVIDWIGDIYSADFQNIFKYCKNIEISFTDGDQVSIYEGGNIESAMNYIIGLVLNANYLGKDNILINLYKFDERCSDSEKPEEPKDTIKHGDKIVFNGKTSHVIDLSKEFAPVYGVELTKERSGVVILEEGTLIPIGTYSSIDNLNEDYRLGENNKIERKL